MSGHTNIVRIKAVARALGALKDKVVFVGGATLSLYATRQVFEVRPTDDVDVIIEVLNYAKGTELDDQLRSIGFRNDVESGVICRWRIEKVIVDIMPTTSTAMGFSNRWYPDGYKNAVTYAISEELTIQMLPAPYFLATKLEAFKDRGRNDGRTSHDFEDIIYILENRQEIWAEMSALQGNKKDYLTTEFRILSNNQHIVEWIDCHVEKGTPPATYDIYDKIKNFNREL